MVLATMLLTPMGVGVRIPSDADQPMPIDSVDGDNGERTPQFDGRYRLAPRTRRTRVLRVDEGPLLVS
jgi:hypothetical protein